MITIDEALENFPMIAILRGIRPVEAVDIAKLLYAKGFRCIEVPLNSPAPYESISMMTEELPEDCITGAGTVLSLDAVYRVREAGGRLIVSPNTNVEVIRATVEAGMIAVPGVATATEAFVAVDAGARHLKLFPATTYGTDHLKALASVLPHSVKFIVTGGVNAANLLGWKVAGAAGFGIGSELYRQGDTAKDVDVNARALCEALRI